MSSTACCKKNPKHHKFPFYYKIKETLSNYKPLSIILAFCFVLSIVKNSNGTIYFNFSMHLFMGYFFIFLSLFKFFDIQGFARNFSHYDFVAKYFHFYSYLYPFLEFALGMAYIFQWNLYWTQCLTVLMMSISGIGVINGILSKKEIKCACLGNVLNVPLSAVSVVENFGMGAMAIYSILYPENWTG